MVLQEMLDWEDVPLERHLELITYGFTNPMPTANEGPFMITAKDINGGRILYEQARFTSIEAFNTNLTDKSRPKINDVLVTKDGTLGRIAVVDIPNLCINQSVALLRPASSLRPRFLKYLLEHPPNFARMINDADGSTIKHIYISRLGKMPVRVPSLRVQDRILDILAPLDDKIDLNRRMNETLEAMARAIFKDWFVDFGPTRAKMEGKAPYLASDLWALFPNRLDDEGKPEGWTNCNLLELCELKRGYDLPTAQRRPGKIPIVSSSGSSSTHDQYMAKGPGVVTGRYGTIGEVFFIEEDFWPLNTALYVCDFKQSEPRYIYYTLKEIDFQIYSDKGAVPGLNRNHLHQHKVLHAPRTVQQAFAGVLDAHWARQRVSLAESRTLAATRDLLLPKLMSGELRVREAEKIMAAVA